MFATAPARSSVFVLSCRAAASFGSLRPPNAICMQAEMFDKPPLTSGCSGVSKSILAVADSVEKASNVYFVGVSLQQATAPAVFFDWRSVVVLLTVVFISMVCMH